MRGYPHLTWALLKSQLRDPISAFFLVAFAPMLLVILGLIFGNKPEEQFGQRGFAEAMLPGMSVISVVVAGVMSVPQNQLLLRASGALTRLRVTPLRPRIYVAADLTVNFVLGLIGALATVVVGCLAFGIAWPAHVLGVFAALALGLVAMLALGHTLAALYPTVGAATGIGNALMILMLITSGALIPTAALPAAVTTVMRFSPPFHIAELVRTSWAGEPWTWVSVLALAGMAVVFGVLGALLFRWDRQR